jgi:hypothetical protein
MRLFADNRGRVRYQYRRGIPGNPIALILEAEKHLPERIFFHRQDAQLCWDFNNGKGPVWAMLYSCVGAKLVNGRFTAFGKTYGKFYTLWFQVTDAASIKVAVDAFWVYAQPEIIQEGYQLDA